MTKIIKNQQGVISPTERSDEGSLTSFRDDNLQTQKLINSKTMENNLQTQKLMNSKTQVTEAPVLPSGDNYRLIPRRAAQVLTPEQLYAYFVLTTYTDFRTHRSEVLEDTLAAQVGVKQGTISKYIAAMAREGLVSVTRTYNAGKKKNHYFVPSPMKDFIIVDVKLRDDDWSPLTVKEQASAKGWMLMVKCLCLNNCNDTFYSVNQMYKLVCVGRDKAQSLMRLLIEKSFASPLEEHFTGYRILGSWFDKGNTYQFPKGTMQLYKDVYNDILTFCHERGMECPPYDKHYVGIIAAQYCVETKTLMGGTLPEDFVEDNRVLFQLRKRLPYMAEAPQSLAYFEKVLTNKLVPKVQPQSYAVTV